MKFKTALFSVGNVFLSRNGQASLMISQMKAPAEMSAISITEAQLHMLGRSP